MTIRSRVVVRASAFAAARPSSSTSSSLRGPLKHDVGRVRPRLRVCVWRGGEARRRHPISGHPARPIGRDWDPKSIE